MIKHINKSVTFSEVEVRSLKRLITSCREAISCMPSDVDFLGWDTYMALHMWDDKLKGRKYELTDYVDVDTDELPSVTAQTTPPKAAATSTPQTIDAWLVEYGNSYRRNKH